MKIKFTKQYHITGELKNEIYHKEGNYMYWHRTDGAAHINYYKSGQKHLESYYQNDLLHRIDGPAYIRYYPSGQKEHESYWQNNQKHRIDGPAIIWYSENGEIIKAKWCINGDRIKPTNLMKLLWKNKSK